MKKGVVIVSIAFILIASALYFADALDNTKVSGSGKDPLAGKVDNPGLWDNFKKKISELQGIAGYGTGYVEKKVAYTIGYLFGATTIEGEGVHILSNNYWRFPYSTPIKEWKWSDIGIGWQNVIFVFITIGFFYIYAPFVLKMKVGQILGVSIYEYYSSTTKKSGFYTFFSWEIHKYTISRLWSWFWKWGLFFLIVGGIPVFNRILQLLSFDFPNTNIFFRALIFMHLITVLYLTKSMLKSYFKRIKNYRKKMHEITINEIEKDLLGD